MAASGRRAPGRQRRRPAAPPPPAPLAIRRKRLVVVIDLVPTIVKLLSSIRPAVQVKCIKICPRSLVSLSLIEEKAALAKAGSQKRRTTGTS